MSRLKYILFLFPICLPLSAQADGHFAIQNNTAYRVRIVEKQKLFGLPLKPELYEVKSVYHEVNDTYSNYGSFHRILPISSYTLFAEYFDDLDREWRAAALKSPRTESLGTQLKGCEIRRDVESGRLALTFVQEGRGHVVCHICDKRSEIINKTISSECAHAWCSCEVCLCSQNLAVTDTCEKCKAAGGCL